MFGRATIRLGNGPHSSLDTVLRTLHCLFLNIELYEICLVRARDKLKILQDAGASSDTDSISSFTGFFYLLLRLREQL